jgi:hypothetical protein
MDMLPLEGMIGIPVVEEREEPLMCIHMLISCHERIHGSDVGHSPRNS